MQRWIFHSRFTRFCFYSWCSVPRFFVYPGGHKIGMGLAKGGNMLVLSWSDGTPSGFLKCFGLLPRVARSSQPWAEGHNPVGIEICSQEPQLSLAWGEDSPLKQAPC